MSALAQITPALTQAVSDVSVIGGLVLAFFVLIFLFKMMRGAVHPPYELDGDETPNDELLDQIDQDIWHSYQENSRQESNGFDDSELDEKKGDTYIAWQDRDPEINWEIFDDLIDDDPEFTDDYSDVVDFSVLDNLNP